MKQALHSRTLMISPPIAVAVLLAVTALGVAIAGDSLVGEVTAVKRGDVVTLDYRAGTYDVHLAGIELPQEPRLQIRAREALAKMVLGKTVRLRFHGRSPDGTMYGRILIGGIGKPDEAVRDVGVELVRSGIVRGHDDGYAYGEMSVAQTDAQRGRRGLWRESQ